MMKKIFASLAAGLIIASAVPVMAAETGTGSDNYRPGYCWQADGSQSNDGYYCGRHHRGGHGGCYWGNQQNNR